MMIVRIPAARLMQPRGRKFGFVLGTVLSIARGCWDTFIYQGHCALLCAGALGTSGLGNNIAFDERHTPGDEAVSDSCADMARVIFVGSTSRLAQVHRPEQKREDSPVTIF